MHKSPTGSDTSDSSSWWCLSSEEKATGDNETIGKKNFEEQIRRIFPFAERILAVFLIPPYVLYRDIGQPHFPTFISFSLEHVRGL